MKKKTLIWIFSIAAILIIVGTVGILTTRDTSTTTNPTPTMVPTTEPTTVPTTEPTTVPATEPTITPNETEPTEVPEITPTEAVTPTLVPTVPVTPTESIPTPTEEPEMIPTETPEVIPTVAPTATSTPTPTPDVPILAPDPNEVLATAPYGDNITGVLTGDGTFTLRGSGVTYDYSKDWNMPHNRDEYEMNNYTHKVKKIVIEEGITEINGYALAFFHNCREVVLPKSLVKIGNNAFMCLGQYGKWTDSKMSGIQEREDQFYTKINLGESNVKEIARGAFKDSTMEAIILPETLEVIGEYAFSNCEWYKWDGRVYNPIIIPASVKQIDHGAFNTGSYYTIKGKSSWDDFESLGYSTNPNYSDPSMPHYSEPKPIYVIEENLTFEP